MLFEWLYNPNANTWELYVSGKMKDRLWKYEDTKGVYWFRGQCLWSDLEVAKKEMEGWYV